MDQAARSCRIECFVSWPPFVLVFGAMARTGQVEHKQMTVRWINILVVGASMLGGCASSHGPFDDGQMFADLESNRTDLPIAQIDATARPSVRSDDGLALAGDMGPDDYVRLALDRNPSIRSSRQTVERLGQRIDQVTSLDAPMFNVAPFGQMAETAAGEVGLMTGISQKLPYPGKLAARGQIAAQQVAMAMQDLESTRLQVVSDTRQAYWSYYFAVRAIEVIERSRELLSQFKDIAQAKNKAGTATQQDVLRASVELSNLDNELITWRGRRTTAVAMLNSLIDRRVTASIPPPKRVDLESVSLNLDRLLADAEQVNPAIARIRQRIEGYRQQLKLAKLNRYPDLTVSLNYVAVDDHGLSPVANGDDQWWFGFGVNLPVWVTKLNAAENEARHGIMEGLADLSDTHNRVAFRVQDASVKVDTQQRLAILFRDVIVPQARQAVDASFSSYRTGQVDFLTLVDNWRKLLNFELMYHQSLAQLEKDFAQLRQAVGRDIERQTPPEAPALESLVPEAQPMEQ
jgi:outer membrane protein TolC